MSVGFEAQDGHIVSEKHGALVFCKSRTGSRDHGGRESIQFVSDSSMGNVLMSVVVVYLLHNHIQDFRRLRYKRHT